MLPYAYFILVIIVLLYCRSCIMVLINEIKRKLLLDRYDNIMKIEAEARDVAFNKVFQDDISKYVFNGHNITIHEDRMDEIRKKFIKLVLKFCGDSVVNDLIYLNGNIDAYVIKTLAWLDIKVNNMEFNVLSKLITNNRDDE